MRDAKGVALYLVLTILLVVVVMANIILSFVSNQSRLAVHQTSRIQAMYGAKAAVNLALEKLRLNTAGWAGATETSFCLCRDTDICSSNSPCDGVTQSIEDPSLSSKIRYVLLTISAPDATDGSRTVQATANYTQ